MREELDERNWGQWIKRERELHGWTQQELANKIGSTPLTISRWERAVKTPGSYFQNKLSALFEEGMEALDLGRKSEREVALEAPSAFIHDVAIPSPSAVSTGLVGRGELLRQLKQWLCTHRGSVALKGMYGAGKTALAAEIAHDYEVRKHYRDGVLWAGLGREPNIPGLLGRWGTLLGVTSAEMAKFTSIEAWARAIHDAIGMRRMLLVVDDAWKAEEVLAFKVGGPNCAHLITTRFRDIAYLFTGNKITTVEELSEDDSVKLLEALAPDVVLEEPNEVRELARFVGGLPLALTIMGKNLQMQADSNQPRRIHTALDRLRKAEERLQLTLLQPPLERPPNLSPGVLLSLQAAIEVSYQQLDEEAKYTLRALSVFPPKSNSFSEEAALRVCELPAKNLDKLTDVGLLESSEQGRYALHQTIADYSQLHLNDAAVEERMVAYFVSYAEMHTTEYDLLELETKNILAIFQIACNKNMLTALLRGVNAFAPFLEARGIYSVAKVYLDQAQQIALSVGDEANLTMTYLHLARIAELSGEFARADQLYEEGLRVAHRVGQAETTSALLTYWGSMLVNRGDYLSAENYLQEGLKLASELDNQQRMCVLLKNLGEVADSRGRYVEGSKMYKQGLKLARHIGDWEFMSALLQNLGVNAERRGDYDQADVYYREGVVCAQKIKHLQRLSALLMNMGMVAFMRKRFHEAEKLYSESLELARKIRNPVRISSVLQNLGMLEGVRARYQDAAGYLQESLDIAYEIGHTWLIYETLCEWGELYLRQGKVKEASTAFENSLLHAREYEFQELIATAQFGLARVALARGDISLARSLGEEGLRVSKEMEHEKAKQIEQWLLSEVPAVDKSV